MKLNYRKLVRDRIPEIIRATGGQCEVKTLPEEEYYQALRSKLVEEAQEAATASSAELISEIADLYEVIDALLTAHNIEKSSVIDMQEQRRLERGGFDQRVFLLWSEKS
ncbi:nucleoside triphosphate pyrophosphohydrolase [Leptolyngbya ohadii]|uniref:nucleoside triphosphate pyrophosphohydrolase n=1 Tax=Leptolyngbya ohadii TaxID=1962290 RepID=UPI000B59ED84|nr:nucleoside triphosphate pyrophosphohydrolase [Leptolyngbya ohadii]